MNDLITEKDLCMEKLLQQKSNYTNRFDKLEIQHSKL